MDIYKWLCRKGTPGQTARSIANLFRQFRKSEPNATPNEICRAIVMIRDTRPPYTAEQFARLDAVLRKTKATMCEFVTEIVMAEANSYRHDLVKSYHSLWEAMAQELGDLACIEVGGRPEKPSEDDLRNASVTTIMLLHLTGGQTLEEVTEGYLRIAGNLSNRCNVWKLSERTWKRLEKATSRTREEWKALPAELGSLLGKGLDCPSCQAHLDARRLVNSDEGSYLGTERPNAIHFRCPSCGVRFVLDTATGSTLLPKAA